MAKRSGSKGSVSRQGPLLHTTGVESGSEIEWLNNYRVAIRSEPTRLQSSYGEKTVTIKEPESQRGRFVAVQ